MEICPVYQLMTWEEILGPNTICMDPKYHRASHGMMVAKNIAYHDLLL